MRARARPVTGDAEIMRYEVAIRPGFVFGFGASDFEELSEPLEIVHGDDIFVWHPARQTPHDAEICGPVLTVMWPDSDSDAAGLACNRFLAALSYALDQPIGIRIGVDIGAGFKQSLDPPMLCQPALQPTLMIQPVGGLRVADDALLYQVLGLYREGLAAESSPYLEFLSLHNALVAAFDGSEDDAEAWAVGRSVIGAVSGCTTSSFCATSTSTSSLSLAASLRRRRPQAPRRAPTRSERVRRTGSWAECPRSQRGRTALRRRTCRRQAARNRSRDSGIASQRLDHRGPGAARQITFGS